MQPIRSIAMLGAGAMGAAFGSALYDTPDLAVSFIARGERYNRLKEQGLTINGRHYNFEVFSPDEVTSPADLILVALKDHHLAEALPDIKPCVGPDSSIISVMNGLDSEVAIGEVYGPERVLYAISIGIDAQRSGNIVNFSKLGTLIFGEATNEQISPQVARVQAMLDHAGISYQSPPDMIRMMWWKFMINVGVNQASSLLRAPYGVFQSNPDAQAIMEAAMREVIACAQAAGVDLVENDIANWYTFLNTLHPQGKTSMLQDVDAGRKTEVGMFAGKVISLGEQYGIPTPVNTLLLHAIRVIECGAI